MKYIIIGLGNFGASLGEKLTAQGNEVIGIDNSMNKVEALKEKLSHTICLDATDEFIVSGLPYKEADVVVIAIGEDQGANVMITANFKNLGVKRLISRAINPLHEKVLQAIGVDEIVHPEEETAERWAKKLCLTDVVDSFELGKEYSLIEVKVPKEFVGKTIREINIKEKFDVLVLTTIRYIEKQTLLGNNRMIQQVQGVADANTLLVDGDILVLFGSNKNLQQFLRMDK